ncbi:MAG TPA: acyl-CoA dehydrogenase [Polyangiaceae bacterium]|jgi:butyryl-CoA dehydrogenase
MALGENPLFDDREIDFQLYDVHDAAGLTALPAFADHSRETFDLLLRETRKVARGALFPAYREIDASPMFEGGAIRLHPKMRELVARVKELGLIPATRGPEVGGQNLPLTIDCVAQSYLCAANLAPASFVILCRGPGHLIEAFGSDELKRRFMEPLYRGEWTGTMALTEPHAGSSLGDITTTARPSGDHFLVRGTKIFISGGDHDIADNIVHLVLARIEGAPAGTKGISLFAIPKKRESGESNDVAVAGMVHKIGWKALPSLIMSFGEHDDCRGWLVGEPNQGLAYMFQMMNEARIGVGLAATATASAAYRQSLDYARTRPQGRALGTRGGAQVPILEHADVRRMLLRQKAIVEGSMSLVIATARYADVASHGRTPEERERAQMLLDLLTPITKTFPAEKGFESTALAVQIHGGYGYSSEYLPEAWLRDQKLNTIHEGTTCIQSLDLLGRKAMGKGGAAIRVLAEEIGRAIEASPEPELAKAIGGALRTVTEASMKLGAMGMGGDADAMMRHSVDYLDMMSTLVIGWQWLLQSTAASKKQGDLYDGKKQAARYFIRTEVPRIDHLAELCTSAEDSFAAMKDAWF